MKDKELIEEALRFEKRLEYYNSACLFIGREIEEVQQIISAFRSDKEIIQRLVKRVEKLQPEPKSIVWEPEVGEEYWYVDIDGTLDDTEWRGGEEDWNLLKHHNAYKTREQAEQAAKHQQRYNRVLQAVLNLEPEQSIYWNDMDQVKHVIDFDHNEGVYYTSVRCLVDNLYPVLTDEKNVQPLLDYLNFKEKSDEIRHQC